MSKKSKVACISKECVACGTCLKACFLNAIEIKNGIKAIVNPESCVACGKCSKVCPANVVNIIERGSHE